MFWRPADLIDARRQPRQALAETAHRPWPLPAGPWIMGQTWNDLLFAHWPVDPEELRAHVPEQLPLDTFEGSAWIGVTPFSVTGLRPRYGIPLPGGARFPEINVRTYVTVDGKPGIWFFSLDTPNPLANEAARRGYRIPYFRSSIDLDRDGERIRFRSERTQRSAPKAAIDIAYEPRGAVYNAEPGSFEAFACERYCLYTFDGDERILRADIHHLLWPLQAATAEIAQNRMGEEVGLDLSADPILHLSRRQDVVFWWPARA